MKEARILIPMILIVILFLSVFITGLVLLILGFNKQKKAFKASGLFLLGITAIAFFWFVYELMNVD